jgi:hypothetical protein
MQSSLNLPVKSARLLGDQTPRHEPEAPSHRDCASMVRVARFGDKSTGGFDW